jgi:biotin carboxyl carrier protein
MSKGKTSGRTGTRAELPLKSLEIGNVSYQTRLTAKFENRKHWKRPDKKKVLSVIPGTIQKLMVCEGEEVDAGKPLMILEAMKMRNEVCATLRGVVKKIHVREGEQVPKEHLLLEFE